MAATFPSFEDGGSFENCGELSSSIDELACEWRAIVHTLHKSQIDDQDIDPWISSINKVLFLTVLDKFSNNFSG